MTKSLPWLLSSTLLVPTIASALGLGSIKLHSALNQPFKAEIKLLSVNNIPLDDIKVRLASDKDFDRVGIEKTYALSQLKFTVINKSGETQILVTSHDRITEPYLRFLIDVATPHGQFFRAYTVLLDPPNYSVSTQEPVTAKSRHYKSSSSSSHVSARLPDQKAISYRATPVNKADISTVVHSPHEDKPAAPIETVKAEERAIKPPAKPVETAIQATYSIKANDSLYSIAKRYQQANLTIDQIMLAIVGENPEAFVGHNINFMKTGYTLRIPSAAVMQSIPRTQAMQEVKQQNMAWHNRSAVQHVLKPPFFNKQPEPQDENSAQNASQPLIQRKLPISQKATEAQQQAIKNEQAQTQSPPPPQSQTNANLASNIPLPAVLQMRVPKPKGVEASPLLQTSELPSNLERTLRAELAVSAEAVTTARESNMVLQQQLQAIQEQNKQLQAQLAKKEEQLNQLQSRLVQLQRQNTQIASNHQAPRLDTPQPSATTTVIDMPAVAGQAVADQEQQRRGWMNKFFIALLILAGGTVAGAGWIFYRQRREAVPEIFEEPEFHDVEIDQTGDIGTDHEQVEHQALVNAFSEPQSEPHPVLDEAQADHHTDNSNSVEPQAEEVDRTVNMEHTHLEPQDIEFTTISEPITPPAETAAQPEASFSEQDIAEPDIEPVVELEEPTIRKEQAAAVDAETEDDNSIEFTLEALDDDGAGSGEGGDIDEFAGDDVVATKLDLSVAYINMEDYESAKKLLDEVIQDGDQQQQQEARELLKNIPE